MSEPNGQTTILVPMFCRFAGVLHQSVRALCALLLLSICVAQISVVVLRYLFAIGFVELQNFVSYGFAAFCVLVVPLAVRTDEHVRVDVLSSQLTPHYRRWADILAIVICLFPVFGLTLWYATPIVIYSWSILEGSRDTGGLPGYFIVLTALPLSCILMIVEGIVILIDRRIVSLSSCDGAEQ